MNYLDDPYCRVRSDDDWRENKSDRVSARSGGVMAESRDFAAQIICGSCEKPIHYQDMGNRGAWWLHDDTNQFSCRDALGQRHDCNTYHYRSDCLCGTCVGELRCVARAGA